jgi:hypothetical protein
MKRSLLVILAFMGNACPAFTQDMTSLPNCDLVDVQSVYWNTLGEDVTLRTELWSDGKALPSAKFFLTFADGQKIELGKGANFIEDYIPEHYCQEHLKAAKTPIVNSITKDGIFYYADNFHSMTDFNLALLQAEFCKTDNPNYYVTGRGKEYVAKVRRSGSWESQFLTCGPILDKISLSSGDIDPSFTVQDYQRLLSQDAPLIAVSSSAYGVNVYALDKEYRTLHNLNLSGD